MELEKSLLKFIVNMVNYGDSMLLQALKGVAMEQWNNHLLTDDEHCSIEAYIDLRLKMIEEGSR